MNLRTLTLGMLTIALILSGCGQRKTKQDALQQQATETTDDTAKEPQAPAPEEITLGISQSGHLELDFTKESGETISFKFNNNEFKQMSAKLTSKDKAANIRFMQIVMPDGKADGPFGTEVDYELSQNGDYRLLVNENIMAGDPWGGEFTLTLKLTK